MRNPQPLSLAILEKQAARIAFDEAPHRDMIEYALANGGGVSFELDEDENPAVIRRRLQKVARTVEGAGRLKFLPNEDGNESVIQFIFRPPSQPRGPRKNKPAGRRNGRNADAVERELAEVDA